MLKKGTDNTKVIENSKVVKIVSNLKSSNISSQIPDQKNSHNGIGNNAKNVKKEDTNHF